MWTCPSCMAMPVSPAWICPRRAEAAPAAAAWRHEHRNSTDIRPITGFFGSRILASSMLGHRVDQRRLARLDLCHRPLKRRLQFVGVLDRTFGPPAHRAGEAGKVGSRSKQIHADMGAVRIGAAGARDDDLM